jgi:hypothetical protein
MPDGHPHPLDDCQALHPKIARAHAYWRAIHPPPGPQGPVLPGRQHFDPVAIPDVLPGVWMLDVQREPFRLRYRLAGTRIVESIGQEITGRWFDEVHPEATGQPGFLDRYRSVVDGGRPSWRRGRPRLWNRRGCDELENIILPFAGDGTHVDMLFMLTVIYWRDGRSE